jgi:hypothetical protein
VHQVPYNVAEDVDHFACFHLNPTDNQRKVNPRHFPTAQIAVDSIQSSLVDRSAFRGLDLSNCLIESGNRSFVFENAFLSDVTGQELIPD